jgi:hypothetical protein
MVGVVLFDTGILVFCIPCFFNACRLFLICWRFCVVLVSVVGIIVFGLFVVVFCIGLGLYAFSRYSYSMDFCIWLIVGFGVGLAYGNL